MELWNFIKTKALQNKEQLICENDFSISYGEAIKTAEIFSERLKEHVCCAIYCKSELNSAIALLACFAAGVPAVPLSKKYGQKHCEKTFDLIGPSCIITDACGELDIYSIGYHSYIEPATHPAVIMCTSGTTGSPKGVMLSEKNIIANVTDIAEYFAINDTDTILISRPLYHCAVLTGEFLVSLIKGTKIYFYSEEFNPHKMLELISNYSITVFCGTPTLLTLMARFKSNEQANTLKHICISGECMDGKTGMKIAKAFDGAEIYHIYGLTEASPRVSYLPPELFSKYPHCVGIPLKSVSVKILDNNGNPLPKGQSGMLWVSGENIMLGYYGEPEMTDSILQDGWLCTGDIALINEAGLLEIKGRNDHLIIKAGMNIYPAEIESAIKYDSRVKEVLVYGLEDKYGTQIGMKIAGDFSCVREVLQLCVKSMPLFQVPSYIEIVDELPKNGSGKVIRGDKNVGM